MTLPPSTTLRSMRALPETSKSVGSNSKCKQHLIQIFRSFGGVGSHDLGWWSHVTLWHSTHSPAPRALCQPSKSVGLMWQSNGTSFEAHWSANVVSSRVW
jgi:hypothetical protein